ncbi:MAG: hypothetical protein Q8L98_06510 [Chlamydiales bacterium]|nr:hypothetical protein [Chlamydiales bacterium]
MYLLINKQIPWVGDNVQGHSWNGQEIDSTEGFGAYDDVCERYALSGRIVDVGGGAYDTNSAYVAQKYLIDCSVYDPYKRDAEHNRKVIERTRVQPFNGVVSFSVLNVISDDKARHEHIKLCQTMLKTGGLAIFKVWPGDMTEIGKETSSGYQSNRDIHTYVDEIRDVFGLQNVTFDPEHKIVVSRNALEIYPSGSRCI